MKEGNTLDCPVLFSEVGYMPYPVKSTSPLFHETLERLSSCNLSSKSSFSKEK